VNKNDEELKEVEKVAQEIARYIQRMNGECAETLDGILKWWLPQQRLLEQRRKVEKAVAILCQQGVLTIRTLPDGSTLYFAADQSDEKENKV